MISKRATRLAFAQLTALSLVAGLLASPVAAKAPSANLDSQSSAEPSAVSAGALVRLNYWVTNTSNSNYSSFFVDAATPDDGSELVAIVDYYLDPSTGFAPECINDGGDVSCTFGALTSGTTAYVSAIYRVSETATRSWSVPFTASSNGSTSSDGPGQSHGDADVEIASVNIATGNSAGGYVYEGDETVANNQDLNKNTNAQSGRIDFNLDPGDAGFGAAISEQATNTCAPGITTCYGDFNVLEVKGGQTVNGGFTVTLGYFQVPGTAAGGFVHWINVNATNPQLGTDYELIDDACTYGTDGIATNMPCISDSYKLNGRPYWELLMDENGFLRGY